MKHIFRIIGAMSVMALYPVISGAVGTYYNGNLYQNPQQKYNRSGGYYNSYGYGAGRGYGQQNVQNTLGTQKQQNKAKKTVQTNEKHGFVLDAGISHQMAQWEFDMNDAGSKLHYDNLTWNVFDARGAYYFGDDTKMQIKAGLQYGKQFGESTMIDDDLTNSVGVYGTDATYGNYANWSSAMSSGVSKDGSQFGFNVGFGLTDFFTWGRAKVTPSIGFRYFKHKLTTESNKGLSVEVFNSDLTPNCDSTQPGEMQCNPYVGVFALGSSGEPQLLDIAHLVGVADTDGDGYYDVFLPAITASGYLDFGQTYYYEQVGMSHKYETTWMGPYLALDMEYQINNDNLITGGIELGLPIYKSEGTQPYRWDWQQSPSVEDEGGLGDAYHLGLNMNWVTAISDSVMFSLGFTYDYYKVSDATAKTYYSPEGQYTLLWNGMIDEDEYNRRAANGWVEESNNEINSVYKSMGIRAGVSFKF